MPRRRGGFISFIFRSPEDSFYIGNFRDADTNETVTVKGKVYGNAHRDMVLNTEEGRDSYGRHERIVSIEPLPGPLNEAGARRYLESLPGIGPARAGKLVQTYGVGVVDTLRAASIEQIVELCSTTSERATAMARMLRQDDADTRIINSIIAAIPDATEHLIRKIQQHFGGQVEAVLEDPYRLLECPGIGWGRADAIAAKLDVPRNDPRRLRASITESIRTLRDEGSTMFPEERVMAAAVELTGISAEHIEACIGEAPRVERPDDLPGMLQLESDRWAEEAVANWLRVNAGPLDHPAPVDLTNVIDDTLTEEQREAVLLAASFRCLVLTGGPGTGKTYTVKRILRLLERDGEEVALLAPTGKAALRMKEATGREASTIHKALRPIRGGSGSSWNFQHGLKDKLPYTAVIVDETSMVDSWLMSKLLDALPQHCRLILVGDSDQLPSVGPGAVLRDTIESEIIPTARLTKIHRNSGNIVKVCHAVIHGRPPAPEEIGEDIDPDTGHKSGAGLFLIAGATPSRIVDLATDRLVAHAKRLGFTDTDLRPHIQILTPRRQKHPLATDALNKAMQAKWTELGVVTPNDRFKLRIGDRVMQTENDYEIGALNGEQGIVIGMEMGSTIVRFDGRTDPTTIPNTKRKLELAYAITIHKSQGSEWPIVVVPISSFGPFLDRNMLYTAVSRAKKLCVLIGSTGDIAYAASLMNQQRRETGLRPRLSAVVASRLTQSTTAIVEPDA